MKILIFLIVAAVSIQIYSQTDKELALKYGKEGVELVDKGQFDDGIKLFEKAKLLDSSNIIYPYEIAYAFYLKKDYKEAIRICEPLRKHIDAEDEVFRLLGNCYDYSGEQTKALEMYNAGLEKFPESGKLYNESGVCYLNMSKIENAITSFESGVRVAPNYPSTYYNLAKIYYNTEDEIWALLYAETFINLERNTERTEELSKLLYDTYLKGIVIKDEKNGTISFCRNPDLNSKKLLMFEVNFEMGYTVALAVSEVKSLSLTSVSKIRQIFFKLWYEKDFDDKYSIGLFDYLKDLYDKGYGKAYDYYCMGRGDVPFAADWIQKNEKQYKDFEKYYVKNKLKLYQDNSVFRGK